MESGKLLDRNASEKRSGAIGRECFEKRCDCRENAEVQNGVKAELRDVRQIADVCEHRDEHGRYDGSENVLPVERENV